MSPYRQIIVDGKCIDFTSGFTDLHRHSYFNIINGSGFSIDDVKTTIYTLETIRNAGISTLNKRGIIHFYIVCGYDKMVEFI